MACCEIELVHIFRLAKLQGIYTGEIGKGSILPRNSKLAGKHLTWGSHFSRFWIAFLFLIVPASPKRFSIKDFAK